MQKQQHQQKLERLPPGFRFLPTDEELITCYLSWKAVDISFTSAAIRDVDLYKFDPWDLPCQELQQTAAAAGGGDRHQQECCYFFCTKGSKYSTGVRARRATWSGYWKSTGKDKAVYSSAGGRLVGMKKTLVFYGGRAPRGKKTGWIMHEYALAESALLRGAQSEWVICRVLMRKDPSSDKKPATETVYDQLPSPPPPGRLLPMESDGCEGEQDAAEPPTYSHRSDSQSGSGVHAMDGDEKDRRRRQMAHEEILTMNNSSGSSCTPPPWPWRIHDDQLGTDCSVSQFMQMRSDHADYSLPELLEYHGYDDQLKRSGDRSQDRRAQMNAASVDSIHLEGLDWNFGL